MDWRARVCCCRRRSHALVAEPRLAPTVALALFAKVLMEVAM